jgi:hypothetical protein
MEGIDFLVDSKGNQIAVQIDLRTHRDIWEDFYDTLIARLRKNEPTETWEKVKKHLISAGKWDE